MNTKISLFGKGKTEILEKIEQEGSIAKAAETMGLNYKKAWTHVKILQENIADQLVVSNKGGGIVVEQLLLQRQES